jgi:hypothetical protein
VPEQGSENDRPEGHKEAEYLVNPIHGGMPAVVSQVGKEKRFLIHSRDRNWLYPMMEERKKSRTATTAKYSDDRGHSSTSPLLNVHA